MRSVWFLRVSSLFVLVIFYILTLSTIQGWPWMNASKPYVLFFIFYLVQLFLLVGYLILQVVYVWKYMDHRWPLGDLFFGILFFMIGEILVYFFSIPICESSNHYIDGFFFSALFNLLSTMMVYKYWDSITKEDLEFAIPFNKIQMTLNEQILKYVK
ncbi:Chitin synthase, class 7 [Coelomomyces lativittatus]|nr:Chitin synthase, class 7 [Coelomomyces lativittatus]KAJ1514694.1 Chitin synthase, class 7 [Coelomomyces lativittatus]KAJ1517642.1 Chitin synthase, class 7 [Coelomomyces lativittatus]